MLRQWVKEHRRFLVAAPFAVIVGFAWPSYHGWDGKNGNPTHAVDVAEGEVGHYMGADFKLKRLRVEEPKTPTAEESAPQDAVVVVATFRGRMPDRKTQKDLYCSFTAQNADGWEWDSATSVDDYVPEHTSTNCNGQALNDQFKEVYPKPGEWFDFAVGFTVPKSRAVGLRPTLSYYKQYPDYLRFEH